jgi:HSP20 family molecular chaperone IbpA
MFQAKGVARIEESMNGIRKSLLGVRSRNSILEIEAERERERERERDKLRHAV